MNLKTIVSLCLAMALGAGIATAQTPVADTVLINGKVVTLDDKSSVVQAVAIRAGRIQAVGSNEEIRKLAGPDTRVVDVGGRTVIPGLMDSHIHAIRAGLTYSVEVSWIGVPSLAKGLERIRDAARTSKPDQWIKVGGGWTDMQFPEKRGPTLDEIKAAAPGRKVYVQRLYNRAWVTPEGLTAMGITKDTKIPTGKAELDASGNLTGEFTGSNPAYNFLVEKIPGPTFQDQVEGTKAYFRELNRLGMTAVNDVTGGGLWPVHFQPVQKVWRDGQLTVRVGWHFQPQIRGKEFEMIQQHTAMLPMGFGDDMFRFQGLGESITAAMFDGSTVGAVFNPTDADLAEFEKILTWAAGRGYKAHVHASTNKAAAGIMTIYESINKKTPISNLRWQITHIEDATEETLKRMKALNIGWSVQDRLLYAGTNYKKLMGEAQTLRAPPIKTGLKLGLKVAAGTDSDQVAPYNPFTSLKWLLDGKGIDGTPLRGPEESPNREEALRMYTINSAWFTFDEDKRGNLVPGKYADLAVLSADYMTVPVDKVGDITSYLTLLGGKAVFGDGPFKDLEGKLK
jgi:predicted amidohydrolase YtcJ